MIVKNEEAQLRRCLDSIRDAVDEIVIVDTGSTDGTIEIAKEYTGKVYHFQWCDDFSAARNESLKYATGDWVLIIDADEELNRADIPEIRKIIEREDTEKAGKPESQKAGEFNSVVINILNKTEAGWSKHHQDRLFRRGTMHYEGIIHNQAITEGRPIYHPFTIFHYGYGLDPEKMKAKHQRTEALLRKQIEQEKAGEPESRRARKSSAFAYQNLVRVLRAQKKYREAIEVAEEVLMLESSDRTYQMILVDLVDCLTEEGIYDEAIGYGLTLTGRFPDNIDGWYYLGRAYSEAGEYTQAIHALRNYMDRMKEAKLNPVCDSLIVDTWGNETKALKRLGMLHIIQGEVDEALSAYRTAIDMGMGSVTFTFADIADGIIIAQAANVLDMSEHSGEFGKFVKCLINSKQKRGE